MSGKNGVPSSLVASSTTLVIRCAMIFSSAFAIVLSRLIGRYPLGSLWSLPSFGMRMMIASFQCAGS